MLRNVQGNIPIKGKHPFAEELSCQIGTRTKANSQK